MARPSEEERKKIAARRVAKQKLREDANHRAAEIHTKVQGLIDAALKKSRTARGQYDLDAILEGLEHARVLAMQIQQPNSAVNALMAMAKLQGLVIEQQIVGAPQEFANLQGDAQEQQLAVLERLRERISERYGSAVANRATARFTGMLEDLRSGKFLDGEADDDAAKPH
jgi:hypothetical protein